MSDEQKFNIQDFDEYIRQGEPDKKEKTYIWQTAIGLQAVDGLSTSEYLKKTAKRNFESETGHRSHHNMLLSLSSNMFK